jgi:hypothetical protein
LRNSHGDETAAYCEQLGRPMLKAIRLRDRRSFLALAEFQGRAGVRGFLVDAFSPDAYGGTGQVADWALAAEAATVARILLAGGLTPGNVAQAIEQVRPLRCRCQQRSRGLARSGKIMRRSGLLCKPSGLSPARVSVYTFIFYD